MNPVFAALIFWTTGFLTGAIVGDAWSHAGWWMIGCCIVITAIWRFPRWWLRIVMIAGFILGCFIATHALDRLAQERDTLGTLVGWTWFTHQIEGVVTGTLSVTEYSRNAQVTLTHVDKKPLTQTFSISLSTPANIVLTPGDTVVAEGSFAFPRDTAEYAGEKTLWYRGMVASFRSFHSSKTSPPQYSIFVRMQQWFDDRLHTIFPQTGHDLLSGILLGQRTTLDTAMRDQLKASGLMHIMVVSGGNIIMLIVFLSLFIRSFPVWIRIGIITVTVVGFVFLVGGDMPVWRAALMGVIGYGVSLWWYRFPPLILPLGVAFLIALVSPLSILYDVGLQLSFLSVVCIIVWWASLTRFFSFLGSFFSEAVALTIAATIGTAPISLYYFGTFSFVSPLANLFAAPAIPILMYGGIATLFASSFSETLAYYLGFIPWVASGYLYAVIRIFGQPWALAHVELGVFGPYCILATLGILVIAIVRTQMIASRLAK